MLTAENYAANLRTAARVIRQRLSLGDDETQWTFQQRQVYNQQLAEYIAAHPASFSAQVLEVARRRLTENPANVLLDTSLDFSAGIDVGLDSGKSTIATAAKWGLGALLLLGALWIFVNRPRRSA
ncbi:MAG TPA: hypothetical protein VEB66_02285 [Opitutaceae bacterium]|nr:hypothetical protein [Opitutaceae bacterium]